MFGERIPELQEAPTHRKVELFRLGNISTVSCGAANFDILLDRHRASLGLVYAFSVVVGWGRSSQTGPPELRITDDGEAKTLRFAIFVISAALLLVLIVALSGSLSSRLLLLTLEMGAEPSIMSNRRCGLRSQSPKSVRYARFCRLGWFESLPDPSIRT